METLPFEQHVNVLQYVRHRHHFIGTSKFNFILRKHLQIINLRYLNIIGSSSTINDKVRLVNELNLSGNRFVIEKTYDNAEFRRYFRRTKINKITIDQYFYTNPNVFFKKFKTDCKCLKFCFIGFRDKITILDGIKTLIIMGENKITDLVLPDTLRTLIIPHMTLQKYPLNLKQLSCLNVNNMILGYLTKLKKLTLQTYYSGCILPMNIEELCIHYVSYMDKFPPKLKKLEIYGDNLIIPNIPVSLTSLKCDSSANFNYLTELINLRHLSLHTSFDIDFISNNKMNARITSLTINIQIPVQSVIDKIKNYFHFLEKLTIIYEQSSGYLCSFDGLTNNLKKLKLICKAFNNNSFNILSFPPAITHLSYDSYCDLPNGLILPSKLTYLKLITRKFQVMQLQLSISLKTLITDIRINQVPINLVYLNIISSDYDLLISIRNLSNLKYLILNENCDNDDPKFIVYPKSLRFLKKTILKARDIPKHIHHVIHVK